MAARKNEEFCELLLVIGQDDSENCAEALAVLLPSTTRIEIIKKDGEWFAKFLVTQEIAHALETLFPAYFKSIALQVPRARKPSRLLKKAS